MFWKPSLRIPFAVLCNATNIKNSKIITNVKSILPTTRIFCSSVPVEDNKKQLVKVNGFKINFKIYGEGNQTLLLVPGVIGCIKTDFDPIIPDILKNGHFRIVAFDAPGYGFSRPPSRDYSGDFCHRDADVAATLMEKLGLVKYCVFGWSTGGICAAFMAADHPNRVNKLVTLGSPAYADAGLRAYIKGISNLRNWPESLKDQMLEVYGQTYFEQLLISLKGGYEAYHNSTLSNEIKMAMNKIACPTLILHGEKDPVVGTEHAEFYHRNIRGSIVKMIHGGKHNLHLTKSKEFLNLIIPFLLDE